MATAAIETMDKRWYIVHAYSNFEKKVAESIREQAKQRGLGELFDEIMVPKEKVVEVRRGRKVDTERKFFPGYVLVKMKLTDEAFHLIKNTPKVTGFLGTDKKPMPITEAEAQRILQQVQEGVERPKMETLTFTRPFSSSTSSTVPLKLVNGPSATRTCSPTSNSTEGRGCSTPSFTWLRMRCASASLIGAGRLRAPRKPVTFGVSFTRCQASSVISIFTST